MQKKNGSSNELARRYIIYTQTPVEFNKPPVSIIPAEDTIKYLRKVAGDRKPGKLTYTWKYCYEGKVQPKKLFNVQRIKSYFFILFASLAISLFTIWYMNRYERKVVYVWKQPDTIDYKSFDPYYLSVVSADIDWQAFPLYLIRNYFIYIGRESGEPTYGHFIKFSFHPDDMFEVEEFIKQSVVEWNVNGVFFKPKSGHQLFIPKRMFIGGR